MKMKILNSSETALKIALSPSDIIKSSAFILLAITAVLLFHPAKSSAGNESEIRSSNRLDCIVGQAVADSGSSSSYRLISGFSREFTTVGGRTIRGAIATGGIVYVCDCETGDPNNSGTINILDITYLISFLYQDGPDPMPYPDCSGDPNATCAINILDITYLIAYLYQGGPPPVSCEVWINNCGHPLRLAN